MKSYNSGDHCIVGEKIMDAQFCMLQTVVEVDNNFCPSHFYMTTHKSLGCLETNRSVYTLHLKILLA